MAQRAPSSSPAGIPSRSFPRPLKIAADVVISALALCVLAGFTYMVFGS